MQKKIVIPSICYKNNFTSPIFTGIKIDTRTPKKARLLSEPTFSIEIFARRVRSIVPMPCPCPCQCCMFKPMLQVQVRIQHGHGQAACSSACCMFKSVCSMDMDIQHTHGHAASIWTRSMYWDMQHRHGHEFGGTRHVHVHAACPYPFYMLGPCCISQYMLRVHIHAAWPCQCCISCPSSADMDMQHVKLID
jgi:hypothetical protein